MQREIKTLRQQREMVANISSNNTIENSTDTDKNQIIDSLIQLATQEQERGNKSVTPDKLAKLKQYLDTQAQNRIAKEYNQKNLKATKFNELPRIPKPKFSPLFDKFELPEATPQTIQKRGRVPKTGGYKKISFKKLEAVVVEVLETTANILDNLHLFSKLPMFPKNLLRFLKQTNKLWVLILVFLIRKTISQLLNVMRKERKVNVELDILNSTKNNSSQINNDINKKYAKILKDLKFDKLMLYIELVGNFLDLSFNIIELYGIPVADWFMGGLNVASMFMTIYRMNKDDEYVDDDITGDLI